MRRATVLWVLLATSGVMLVAGVTLAASTLSTQSVGLSSEPLSAGDDLAPEETSTPTPRATRNAHRSRRAPRPPPPREPAGAHGDAHARPARAGRDRDAHGGRDARRRR